MSLGLQSVLITRAEPDASETAAQVSALGRISLVAPLFTMEIRPLRVSGLGAVAATLLTSRNAIPACPNTLHTYPAFAVGPATTARAQAAGFQHVLNADGNAKDLARLVASILSPGPGRLLLPTTVGQGLPLVNDLRAHGFRVVRRIAYTVARKSVLPPEVVHALQDRALSHALFFSSESAAHFTRLVIAAGVTPWLGFVDAVTISERTGMALRRLPWRRICVASKPNQDAMLALLT